MPGMLQAGQLQVGPLSMEAFRTREYTRMATDQLSKCGHRQDHQRLTKSNSKNILLSSFAL